jgi:hypothetical protein
VWRGLLRACEGMKWAGRIHGFDRKAAAERVERCAECQRPPFNAADYFARWRYWMGVDGELVAFCPACALREFQYLIRIAARS